MPKKLSVIKYVFVHLDGVLIDNILGNIVKAMVNRWGGEYTAEVENNVFARSEEHVSSFFIKQFNLSLTQKEILEVYYEERKKVEESIKINKQNGLKRFLELSKLLNLKVVSYGAAPMAYFLKNMSKYLSYFSDEKYIETKKIRPGVKEIIKGIYNIKYSEALFIDEANTVAKAAKKNKVPFIGMPSFKKGFQKGEMQNTNVKYLVSSLNEIDYNLLKKIDKESKARIIWK